MRRLVIALVLTACAGAAGANIRNCNAALVSAGVCPNTAHALLSYAINTADPDNGGPEVAHSQLILDAYSQQFNWQATTVCIQEMVNQGTCNSGQLGTQVSESKTQFTDRMIRRQVLSVVKAYRSGVNNSAAQAATDAAADPDIKN